MKKLLLPAVILFCFTMTLKSQDPEFEYYKGQEIKTLLGRNKPGGTYGSLTIGYTLMDNKNALIFGARISGIASHYLGVGIGANAFFNEYSPVPLTERQFHLSGGYGGIYVEPILLPKFPAHLSFPVLLGVGGVSSVSYDSDSQNRKVADTKAFLLIEPSAEIELNVTRHFRMAVGLSYRFPTAFNIGPQANTDTNVRSLKGLSYKVTFKLGKF